MPQVNATRTYVINYAKDDYDHITFDCSFFCQHPLTQNDRLWRGNTGSKGACFLGRARAPIPRSQRHWNRHRSMGYGTSTCKFLLVIRT